MKKTFKDYLNKNVITEDGEQIFKIQKPEPSLIINVTTNAEGTEIGDCTVCGLSKINKNGHLCQTAITESTMEEKKPIIDEIMEVQNKLKNKFDINIYYWKKQLETIDIMSLNNILKKLKEKFNTLMQNHTNQYKKENVSDLIDYTIPSWAISSLINGDDSGLNDEEIEKINNFTAKVVANHGNANFMLGDSEGDDNLGFCHFNDIDNLGDNCETLYIRPSKIMENKINDLKEEKAKLIKHRDAAFNLKDMKEVARLIKLIHNINLKINPTYRNSIKEDNEGPQPGDVEYHYSEPKKNTGIGNVDNIDWQVLHQDFMNNANSDYTGYKLGISDLTEIGDEFLTKEELNILIDKGIIYVEDGYPMLDDGNDEDYNTFLTHVKSIWPKNINESTDYYCKDCDGRVDHESIEKNGMVCGCGSTNLITDDTYFSQNESIDTKNMNIEVREVRNIKYHDNRIRMYTAEILINGIRVGNIRMIDETINLDTNPTGKTKTSYYFNVSWDQTNAKDLFGYTINNMSRKKDECFNSFNIRVLKTVRENPITILKIKKYIIQELERLNKNINESTSTNSSHPMIGKKVIVNAGKYKDAKGIIIDIPEGMNGAKIKFDDDNSTAIIMRVDFKFEDNKLNESIGTWPTEVMFSKSVKDVTGIDIPMDTVLKITTKGNKRIELENKYWLSIEDFEQLFNNGHIETVSNENKLIKESQCYYCDTCGERAEHEELEENPNMKCGNCGNRDWVSENEYDSEYDSQNESTSNLRYELHYTIEHIRGLRRNNSPSKLILWAKQQKGITEWDLFRNDSGFHSSTQDEYLINWWDKSGNSYWSNMSKKNPALLKKQYKTVTNERIGSKLITSIKEYKMLTEKSNYEVYHNTYTSAVNTALEYAESLGYTYNKDEVATEIGTGPRKPDEGKTNKFTITLFKDDKESKKSLHIQIYGMDKKYELNTYIN